MNAGQHLVPSYLVCGDSAEALCVIERRGDLQSSRLSLALATELRVGDIYPRSLRVVGELLCLDEFREAEELLGTLAPPTTDEKTAVVSRYLLCAVEQTLEPIFKGQKLAISREDDCNPDQVVPLSPGVISRSPFLERIVGCWEGYPIGFEATLSLEILRSIEPYEIVLTEGRSANQVKEKPLSSILRHQTTPGYHSPFSCRFAGEWLGGLC